MNYLASIMNLAVDEVLEAVRTVKEEKISEEKSPYWEIFCSHLDDEMAEIELDQFYSEYSRMSGTE